MKFRKYIANIVLQKEVKISLPSKNEIRDIKYNKINI